MTRPFDAEAHVLHMSRVLDLPLAAAWRNATIANMAATAAAAELVLTFPLDDHAEPAPVFVA